MEFKEYLCVIKKRFWLILICVVISTICTAAFSSYNYVPTYQASTKLIINKTVELDQFGKEMIDFGAIGFNMSLINTYTEIMKTPAIMNRVVQRYPDLQVSAEQLITMVKIGQLNGTQVMTLTVEDRTYERAVKIVNAVTEVFQSEIPKIMKVDNISLLNMAQLKENPQPINQRTNISLIIGFVISLIISVGLAFLLEFMDDTLKKEAELKQLFGVPVLASVPKLKKVQLQQTSMKQRRSQIGEVANVTGK
ncbi:YveK family protein [Paenibacillus silviterrae]|uniref:YveK family protein n=1 Tax=Paenibacillus silviterrae TaxID=3242194 RepID=UPI002543223F|nr:Wzz/FepE/Etk N-terminal domain-containing protein [Paenibacillus chinjuensis]